MKGRWIKYHRFVTLRRAAMCDPKFKTCDDSNPDGEYHCAEKMRDKRAQHDNEGLFDPKRLFAR
jgi:hypothetical protein